MRKFLGVPILVMGCAHPQMPEAVVLPIPFRASAIEDTETSVSVTVAVPRMPLGESAVVLVGDHGARVSCSFINGQDVMFALHVPAGVNVTAPAVVPCVLGQRTIYVVIAPPVLP